MTNPDQHSRKKFVIGDALSPVLRLAIGRNIPALLVGDAGIGKSDFVRQIAASLQRRVIVVNLALFESPADLVGLPYKDGDVTRYRRPSMLPDGGSGILVIEEAARAARHVMAPFCEFLTSRRIMEYELPADWAIVACMNPPGADYDGEPFDRALRDRFLHLEVVADLGQWLRWADANGIHPAVRAALVADARVFALASPRTWHRASQLLLDAVQVPMTAAAIEGLLASALGSVEAAHAVMRRLAGAGEDVDIAPSAVLARYAADAGLQQALRRLLEQGRTDAVEKLVCDVERLLTDEALDGMIATGAFDLASLERFASDVPGDRGAALLRRFAENPGAGAALAIEPEEVFVGYRGSRLRRQVGEWLRLGLLHRLRALVRRVTDHLVRLDVAGRTASLRQAMPVRQSLWQFCDHVGDEASPLRAVAAQLGLAPEQAEAS